MSEIRRLSPHQGPRLPHRPITLIVMHADAAASEQGTLSWFQDPASKVSYHVLIGRTDAHGITPVYRVVDDERVAWHAGVSKHPACANPKSVNSESLGISFANRHNGAEALSAGQKAAAKAVIAAWRAKYPTIVDVVTHANVAPSRKTDPDHAIGFDLAEYRAA